MQRLHDVPAPESVPPVPPVNPDPQPGDAPRPVPPAEDERGPQPPVKLPGNPGAPERVH